MVVDLSGPQLIQATPCQWEPGAQLALIAAGRGRPATDAGGTAYSRKVFDRPEHDTLSQPPTPLRHGRLSLRAAKRSTSGVDVRSVGENLADRNIFSTPSRAGPQSGWRGMLLFMTRR